MPNGPSQPWFFADTRVDHAALELLHQAAAQAGRVLEAAGQSRLHSGTRHLARCAGPFADDLAAEILRRAARDEQLAEQCHRLAQLALDAADAARAEQVRRESLRDVFTAEVARDRQAAARAAAPAGTAA